MMGRPRKKKSMEELVTEKDRLLQTATTATAKAKKISSMIAELQKEHEAEIDAEILSVIHEWATNLNIIWDDVAPKLRALLLVSPIKDNSIDP